VVNNITIEQDNETIYTVTLEARVDDRCNQSYTSLTWFNRIKNITSFANSNILELQIVNFNRLPNETISDDTVLEYGPEFKVEAYTVTPINLASPCLKEEVNDTALFENKRKYYFTKKMFVQ
jgi:hypothetical protein